MSSHFYGATQVWPLLHTDILRVFFFFLLLLFFFLRFFDVDHFLSVTILLLFYVLGVFLPQGMWDISAPTGD